MGCPLPTEFFLGDCAVRGRQSSPLDDVRVRLFNVVWSGGGYPEAWRIAALVPLLKGGSLDKDVPSNYRGIALLAALSKLFACIVERRISEYEMRLGRFCAEHLVFFGVGVLLTQCLY